MCLQFLLDNYSSLTGGFFTGVLYFIIQMQVLSTVTKATKTGVSTWDFVQQDDGKFAAIKREPQTKEAQSKEDLRTLYSSFLKYGFTPVTD